MTPSIFPSFFFSFWMHVSINNTRNAWRTYSTANCAIVDESSRLQIWTRIANVISVFCVSFNLCFLVQRRSIVTRERLFWHQRRYCTCAHFFGYCIYIHTYFCAGIKCIYLHIYIRHTIHVYIIYPYCLINHR